MKAIPDRCPAQFAVAPVSSTVMAGVLCILVAAMPLLPGGLPSARADTEVAGVSVKDSVEVGGRTLKLNGAGLRSRFFIKGYVGALYLPERTTDGETAMRLRGPKRVAMHVIYKEITKQTFRETFDEGLAKNSSPDELAAVRGKLTEFYGLVPSLKSGDVADFDFVPGQGTYVTINGKPAGSVASDALQGALLRVWLGQKPADDDLKRGMLGD